MDEIVITQILLSEEITWLNFDPINELKPALNVQSDSIRAKVFN